MRDPKERLLDILDAIAAIERHRNQGQEAFERDELLQGWFVRQLQIIGEAAGSLPEALRAKAPEIPWVEIIGMRNVLVHGYFEIDTDIVWDAVIRDVLLFDTPITKRITEDTIKAITVLYPKSKIEALNINITNKPTTIDPIICPGKAVELLHHKAIGRLII